MRFQHSHFHDTACAETTPDERLALAAQNGNQQAYSTLMQRYRSAAYAYAFSQLRCREEAEDAVQDTLLRAYEALPRFRTDGCWGAWMMRILRNRCRDSLRRRRAHPQVTLARDCQDPLPTPEGHVMALAARRELHSAFEALPDKYREIVGLHYAAGHKSREIAQHLGLPETTVKGRLVSALRLLRRHLERDRR